MARLAQGIYMLPKMGTRDPEASAACPKLQKGIK